MDQTILLLYSSNEDISLVSINSFSGVDSVSYGTRLLCVQRRCVEILNARTKRKRWFWIIWSLFCCFVSGVDNHNTKRSLWYLGAQNQRTRRGCSSYSQSLPARSAQLVLSFHTPFPVAFDPIASYLRMFYRDHAISFVGAIFLVNLEFVTFRKYRVFLKVERRIIRDGHPFAKATPAVR